MFVKRFVAERKWLPTEHHYFGHELHHEKDARCDCDCAGQCSPRGELCSRTHFSLAEILVLDGGAILPAGTVPTSTRISVRLKCAGNTVHP